MAEDILHRIREQNANLGMDSTTEIYNEALIRIENLGLNIANKLLNQLGMPSPTRFATAAPNNVDMRREQNYNPNDLLSYVQCRISFKAGEVRP